MSKSKIVSESTCPERCNPVEQPKFYHNWLVTAHPPNSYTIEIAYTKTTNPVSPGTYSTDDSYSEDELNWMTMPQHFTNFAQAKVHGFKYYPGILFRIGASSEEPNYFKYDSYNSQE